VICGKIYPMFPLLILRKDAFKQEWKDEKDYFVNSGAEYCR
jgi:hypothetical protein